MKPLLPCLKEKKRYIAFEILSKHKFSFREVSTVIWGSAKEYIGYSGLARAGIWLLPDKYRDNKGIIKVCNKEIDNLRASFTFIEQIDNKDVIVRSIGMSGILRKVTGVLENA